MVKIWKTSKLSTSLAQLVPSSSTPPVFRVRGGANVEAPWGGLDDQQRIDLKDRVYDVIRNRRGVLFACAVEKRYAEQRYEDPYERAYEDIISRFDLFLTRVNTQAIHEGREEQRGLIVLAESSYQKAIGFLLDSSSN